MPLCVPFLKDNLCCKTIAFQNLPSDAQVKNVYVS